MSVFSGACPTILTLIVTSLYPFAISPLELHALMFPYSIFLPKLNTDGIGTASNTLTLTYAIDVIVSDHE